VELSCGVVAARIEVLSCMLSGRMVFVQRLSGTNSDSSMKMRSASKPRVV